MHSEVLVKFLEDGEIEVVQQELGVVVVLLLEGVGTLPHDQVDHLPQVLGRKMLQFLLKLHLLVVGHLLFILLLLEQVILDWPSFLAPAGAGLSLLKIRLLPGTVMGMLGR